MPPQRGRRNGGCCGRGDDAGDVSAGAGGVWGVGAVEKVAAGLGERAGVRAGIQSQLLLKPDRQLGQQSVT